LIDAIIDRVDWSAAQQFPLVYLAFFVVPQSVAGFARSLVPPAKNTLNPQPAFVAGDARRIHRAATADQRLDLPYLRD
jgi:hypothetical protein